MTYSRIVDPAWYLALTLAERIASLPQRLPDTQQIPYNHELAARRFQRWQSQTPFASGSAFAERLMASRVSVDTFQALLGEPIEQVAQRELECPHWLERLLEVYAGPEQEPLPLPDGICTPEQRAFLHLAEPLITRSRQELRARLAALTEQYPELPLRAEQLEPILLSQLPARLFPLLARTMILELNIARLQGLLTGESAAERFSSFAERLRRREIALELLKQYPPLARQLVQVVEQWASCALEFMQHLCADWPLICARFSPARAPGALVALTSAGDRHCDGRAVLIAHFEHDLRLVYKPTAQATSVHFQQLLAWINRHSALPAFRTLRILDRGSYGWVEWVSAQPCRSKAQLERFYQRQGGYLGLLYALEATDFHAENVIAAGEQPLLIDLETLFHPRLASARPAAARLPGSELLAQSVLRVGLLPDRFGAREAGIDLSGLGQVAGQLTPYAVAVPEACGTDTMRIAQRRISLPATCNQPTLNGVPVNVQHYSAAIVAGFRAMYRLLLEQRAALLAPDGPLARFAHDRIRVLVRDTQTYATLLDASSHPDLLHTALDRDRLFDKLWVAVGAMPSLKRVIEAERADLEQHNIPLFSSYVDSRDAWSSRGERIGQLFAASGLSAARRRLGQLDADDLAQQTWIIQAALATSDVHEPGPSSAPPIRRRRSGPADPQRSLAAATIVAERIAALAIQRGGDTGWVGLSFKPSGQHVLRPLGVDLYAGLPGVALFLAHCGALSGQQHLTELAQRAMRSLLRYVDQKHDLIQTIGGFSGWGGIVYTLAQLGALWRQPALLRTAERYLPTIAALVGADQHLDIVDGAAGCIGGLLALHRSSPSGAALALAQSCGQHLLQHARPMAAGLGWPGTLPTEAPLLGFAHGAAGIGWALAELGAATKTLAFREAAHAALSYERSSFDPGCGWPDRRLPADDEPRSMSAWCHGAVGIGLMRLHLLRQQSQPELRGEVRAAVQQTLEQGTGQNHSLCHGDLGRLELLIQASAALGDCGLCIQAEQLSASIVAAVEQRSWRCGTPGQIESPGLMSGLAGIGYGLLRLAAPERVPAVLLLAPPKLAAQQARSARA